MNRKGKERRPAGPAGARTVDEAADYLRISRSGVYRLFKVGALPKAMILGRTVVRQTDLDAFLEGCVEAPPRPTGVKAA